MTQLKSQDFDIKVEELPPVRCMSCGNPGISRYYTFYRKLLAAGTPHSEAMTITSATYRLRWCCNNAIVSPAVYDEPSMTYRSKEEPTVEVQLTVPGYVPIEEIKTTKPVIKREPKVFITSKMTIPSEAIEYSTKWNIALLKTTEVPVQKPMVLSGLRKKEEVSSKDITKQLKNIKLTDTESNLTKGISLAKK